MDWADWLRQVDFKVWTEPSNQIDPAGSGPALDGGVPPGPQAAFNPLDPVGEVKKRRWYVGLEVKF